MAKGDFYSKASDFFLKNRLGRFLSGSFLFRKRNGDFTKLGAAISKYGSSWLEAATGTGLTAAEMAANEFSHNEAQIARDWQEKFYLQYESPAAQVRQYQAAGLNPALMYGSSPAPSPSVGLNAPSSVSPSSSPQSLLEIIPSLAKLKSEIQNINEDSRLKRAEARSQEANAIKVEIDNQTEGPLRDLEVKLKQQGVDLNNIEIEWKPKEYDVSIRKGEVNIQQANIAIQKALKEMSLLDEDILLTHRRAETELAVKALTLAQKTLADKQGEYISLQSVEQEWRNEFIKTTNMEPATSIWELLPSVFYEGKHNILDKLVEFLNGSKRVKDSVSRVADSDTD